MRCSDYANLIALAAAGEATDAERQQIEDHTSACEACQSEYARLTEIVADLSAPNLDTLSPGERLQRPNMRST